MVSEEGMSLESLKTEVQGLEIHGRGREQLERSAGARWDRVLQALLYFECKRGLLEDYR